MIVATLVDSQLSIGFHEFDFNISNLPSGIYIYKIQANKFQGVNLFFMK